MHIKLRSIQGVISIIEYIYLDSWGQMGLNRRIIRSTVLAGISGDRGARSAIGRPACRQGGGLFRSSGERFSLRRCPRTPLQTGTTGFRRRPRDHSSMYSVPFLFSFVDENEDAAWRWSRAAWRASKRARSVSAGWDAVNRAGSL